MIERLVVSYGGFNMWKVFRIGTVRYNWPMSAHASQAFSIAHCTDSEDFPNVCESLTLGFHEKSRHEIKIMLNDTIKTDSWLLRISTFSSVRSLPTKSAAQENFCKMSGLYKRNLSLERRIYIRLAKQWRESLLGYYTTYSRPMTMIT